MLLIICIELTIKMIICIAPPWYRSHPVRHLSVVKTVCLGENCPALMSALHDCTALSMSALHDCPALFMTVPQNKWRGTYHNIIFGFFFLAASQVLLLKVLLR